MVTPLIGVLALLVFVAFLITLASSLTPPRAQLWVAVLILCLVALLQVWPK